MVTSDGAGDAPRDNHPLDNAVWHALTGPHRPLAEARGQARRYEPEVSVFCGTPDDSARSWDDLADLVGPGGTAVLFGVRSMDAPASWSTVQTLRGHQMVLGRRTGPWWDIDSASAAPGVSVRPLVERDVSTMLDLVDATKPGPFGPRTIRLGGYLGLFDGQELVAMAGRRLRPTGYCEVSAVCVHPDHRRRGLASLVTTLVASSIIEEGETPFLHVADDNDAARAVYESLGFETRTEVDVGIFRAGP